jgi:hypothetical protein
MAPPAAAAAAAAAVQRPSKRGRRSSAAAEPAHMQQQPMQQQQMGQPVGTTTDAAPSRPSAAAPGVVAVAPTAGAAAAGASSSTVCPGVTWLGAPVPPEGVNCDLAGPHRTFYSAFVLQPRPAAAAAAADGVVASGGSGAGGPGWTVRVGDYVLTTPPPGESNYRHSTSFGCWLATSGVINSKPGTYCRTRFGAPHPLPEAGPWVYHSSCSTISNANTSNHPCTP